MRPKGSATVLLARRRKETKLLDEDLSLNEIARRIGCNASSVMRGVIPGSQQEKKACKYALRPDVPRA